MLSIFYLKLKIAKCHAQPCTLVWMLSHKCRGNSTLIKFARYSAPVSLRDYINTERKRPMKVNCRLCTGKITPQEWWYGYRTCTGRNAHSLTKSSNTMSSRAQRFIQPQRTLKVLNAHRNVLLNLEGLNSVSILQKPVIANYTKTTSDRIKQSNSLTPPQPVRK